MVMVVCLRMCSCGGVFIFLSVNVLAFGVMFIN